LNIRAIGVLFMICLRYFKALPRGLPGSRLALERKTLNKMLAAGM
jgi:hypothetical protein